MPMTEYAPGAPNWIDLDTPDPSEAADFYAAVFGWSHQSAGPDAGGYGFFELDGEVVAGVGPSADTGAEATWTVYFHSPDAEATTKAVEQAGGTVRFPPTDVFTAGRLAAFTDPAGADFGVWQPGDRKGLDKVADPDTLSWTELYSTNATSSKDFYRSVFCWETNDNPMGGDAVYTIVAAEGRDVGAGPHGGIMQLPKANLDAGSTSEWHPYFCVTDCDSVHATALDQGATTLISPTDLPGVGRMAMVQDPAGAPFAVIQGDAGGA